MGIDNLSQYGGLYNQYRKPEIPSVDMETVKKQDAQAKEQQADIIATPVNSQPVDTIEQVDQRSRVANLEDISLTFEKDKSFEQIGVDKPLDNLDMQKAVSDMKKDNVFQQYQFFVGSAQNLMQQSVSEDGIVLRKLAGLN